MCIHNIIIYMYIHVHVHTYIHTYMNVYISMHMCTYNKHCVYISQNLVTCTPEGLAPAYHYPISDGTNIPCFVAATGQAVNINILEQVCHHYDNAKHSNYLPENNNTYIKFL